MQGMGVIKGRLSSISKKKKQYHEMVSTSWSSSYNMNDTASVGSSSAGLPSLDEFLDSFIYEFPIDPSQGLTRHDRTRSILPGAISLGSTPCLAWSSSKTDYPGGFLAGRSSHPGSPRGPKQQHFLETEERCDGVPSPLCCEDSRK
jgi:hypothetical protein